MIPSLISTPDIPTWHGKKSGREQTELSPTPLSHSFHSSANTYARVTSLRIEACPSADVELSACHSASGMLQPPATHTSL
eukprot:1291542-Rhodomonas_salina.1